MQQMTRTTKTTILCLFLLTVFASGLFAYSVHLRKPWFGASPICPETWITSGTLLWSRQWYQEGPLYLRFGLFWDPDSVEFPTLASRKVYSSYPPGVVLPIYALSRIFRREPSLEMFMAYGLFNHGTTALLLSFIAFFFSRRCGFGSVNASLLATVPVFAFLLLPSPFYVFQMCYLPDLSVILPFAAYVFLECLRDQTPHGPTRRILSWIQAIIAFFGILCDWLFVLVVFCLYVKRLVTGEIATWPRTAEDNPTRPAKILGRFIRNSARFWFTFGLAVVLFLSQLLYFGQFSVIGGRFRERTGMAGDPGLFPPLDNRFWNHHFVQGFGTVGRTLLCVSFAGLVFLIVYALGYRIIRKRPNASLNAGTGLMFVLLIPCIIYTLVFREHSSHVFHFFTTAKFAMPIAIIPFVLLPLTVLTCFCNPQPGAPNPEPIPRWGRVVPLVLVALAAWYVYSQSPRLLEKFQMPFGMDPVILGTFIDRHTDYADVVFSPDPGLETIGTPTLLAQSMKHVYGAASVQAMWDKLAGVSGEYVVNYLVSPSLFRLAGDDIQRLVACAYASETGNDVVLHKIHKADFLKLCGELGLSS